MSTWILIIAFLGSREGSVVNAGEFHSLADCNAAAKTAQDIFTVDRDWWAGKPPFYKHACLEKPARKSKP